MHLYSTELFEVEMFYILLCVNKNVLILNWIVWNRTVLMYKNGFGMK